MSERSYTVGSDKTADVNAQMDVLNGMIDDLNSAIGALKGGDMVGAFKIQMMSNNLSQMATATAGLQSSMHDSTKEFLRGAKS